MYRWRTYRSPLLYWAAAGVLTLVTVLVVARLVGGAEARAARWGATRSVPVAARAVEAGAVLAEADVAERRLPASVLPDGPIADAPVGRAAAVAVTAGEVLLESKLAAAGTRGAAARMPEGRRGIAVPAGPAGMPPLEPGNRVDLLATLPEEIVGGDGAGAPTVLVARAAVVLDVDDDTATVAVTPGEAARVAFALAAGAVTVVLAP